MRFFKTTKGVVTLVFGAITAVTGWYVKDIRVIYRDREERLAHVDRMISDTRHDTSTRNRTIRFDSLKNRSVGDHLEPHAIRGLLQFIRDARPLDAPCVKPLERGDPRALPVDVTRALETILNLQQRQRRVHSRVDRLADAVFAITSPELVEPSGPPSLDNTDLRGADMSGFDLRSGSLRGSCLAGAHLDSATLDGTKFERAVLRSAFLQDAHGSNVRFDRADLTDADLSGAELRRARFLGATLSCATFGNARLDSAFMSSAVANWTYFGGATLIGVEKWNEIIGFRGAYLAQVQGLPDSLVAFAHARGAAPDTVSSRAWSASRQAQLAPRGLCAPPA